MRISNLHDLDSGPGKTNLAMNMEGFECGLLDPLKALPLESDKTQDKSDGGFEPLHIFTTLSLKPKPSASSRKGRGPYFRRGGLQIWTKNVAGKAGQGNSYRAVVGFCRKRLFARLAAQNARPGFFLWGRVLYRAWAAHGSKIPTQ